MSFDNQNLKLKIGSILMSDINNLGGDQYDHSMKQEDTNTFLQVLYRNVKDTTKRQEIIKLYFGECDDNNNLGDC